MPDDECTVVVPPVNETGRANQAWELGQKCRISVPSRKVSNVSPEYCFVSIAAFANLEDCQEGFLGDVDAADTLHALFAFFLLL